MKMRSALSLPRGTTILLAAMLLFLFILNAASVRHKTPTYDEGYHFQYGDNILKGNPERFDDSKMPFSVLNAASARISPSHEFHPLKQKIEDIRTGRWATILFSLLVAFYVFRWSKKLYGLRAGFFSLFLYIFAPNILAHSRLVTTDLYAAGMTTISCYYFWKLTRWGGKKNTLKSAFSLAISQLAKYSCVFLYPLFLLFSLKKLRHIQKGWPKGLSIILIFLLASVLVINIGFLFSESLKPISDQYFESEIFKGLKSSLETLHLGRTPFFLMPRPYLEGLDRIIAWEKSGLHRGLNYLLGTLQQEGFIGYFLIACLVKVPLAALILFTLSLVSYIRRRRRFNFLRDEIFLLGPAIFFFVYFNFFFKAQMGIRFIIIIFPLLHIFCGSLLANSRRLTFKAKMTGAVLSAYLAISVLSYFPHYLSYFNELVWDRKTGYKILADSNLDWGQNQWYFKQYMEKHPGIVKNPKRPIAGKIAISANLLVGIFYREDFKWYEKLNSRFEPVGHIAHSYLIFDIPPERLHELL